MILTSTRRGRLALTTSLLATAAVVAGLMQAPALAAPDSPDRAATLADPVIGLPDLDRRGTARPSTERRRAAAALGAVDLRWNAAGTPASILPADGSLGAASSSDAIEAARIWLRDHAAVFGLTLAQVDGLELVNDQRLADSDAHAVLFRQTFDGLAPAIGSMVTVGVADGDIAYASSSITPADQSDVAAPALSAVEAWLLAAEDAGLSRLEASEVTRAVDEVTDWTRLDVPGLAQEQQVRLRALPLGDGTVRPVFEANVVDVSGSVVTAYTSLVDAVTGEVLHRTNQVDNHQTVENFVGAFTATDCGPRHALELPDGKTRTIVMAATALPVDDVTIKLSGPNGEVLGRYDLLTSPETGTYTAEKIPAGTYTVQVCPFDDASATVGQYTLSVVTSDQAAPDSGGVGFVPRWRYFPANPTLDSPSRTPENSVVGCWKLGEPVCDTPPGELANVQAFGPWDATASGIPTGTTIGNNANTHEAWGSPLTPGGAAQAPISPTRDYTTGFTDAWNNSRCDPAQLRPGGNDINASVTNLFVAHNRMHDFSYYLGFTEANYNMQTENAGRGGVPGDPEIGNAQAGAITGGQPTLLGRDNANQITLQDGIPGITNQYLFQPIAGAFYAPCTDGGLDMGIIGHEYTHAITNRMVAGPDEGLTSEHGGAMGESWGDLVAAEYQFEHGYDNGGNPWAVGVYATGNRQVAIRDYAINHNPLNFSDYGFDITGAEVHADGEIWNGTMWEVRQALVKKYDDRFPASDRALQRHCADATAKSSPWPAGKCPGNRRWLQLMFDSFLLQQGATSMLDARDALIAADRMRFGGANAKALWDAFARRGMGKGAVTPDADSEKVRPSFASPRSRNARVTFRAPNRGRIYVGDYEARVTPVADTFRRSKLDRTVRLAPGRYRMLYVAPTRAARRFTLRVSAGERRVVRVRAPRNLAARGSGAKVIAASPGSLNAAFLIDGTEATNWGGVNADGSNVDEVHPFVSVDLAGRGVHRVRRVNVSALLRPATGGSSPLPVLADAAEDPDSGSRFTALRRFALERCVRACGKDDAVWKRFYVSRANAFPGKRPRPVAPDLLLRSFDVPDVRAAAIRLVTLENQCTGFRGYAGEQDNDPLNDTDCKTASDRGSIVHAAELQVY